MNYYEPPVQPDVIDCPNECREGMVLFYCEGEIFPEDCGYCDGQGFIEPNLEEEYLTYMEQKYERRKDEF